MKLLIPILTLASLLILGQGICTNEPSCFVKNFLQFQYPKENLYLLTSFLDPNNSNIDVKAYGDFNNDLV